MDVFIEQIIERKPDSRDILLKICVIMATAMLCGIFLVAAFMFSALPMISLFALAVIAGIIWLGVHFLRGLSIEYEYILTNKDLDIDKIMGRRKRKRMITLNLLNAEELDICNEGIQFNVDVTVSAHDNTYLNMWYLLIKDDSYGRVVVLFNPGDLFITKLNKALPPRAQNRKISEMQKT
jgi:hypothetical protein